MRIRFLRVASVMLAATLAWGSVNAQAGAPAPRLDCANGPVTKTYGAQPWMVFACSDRKSIVVVSTEQNRAHPFYFMLYLKGGTRYLQGEGTGSRRASASAREELTRLSEPEISALIDSAMAVPRTQPRS